jgi:hypothetical protein
MGNSGWLESFFFFADMILKNAVRIKPEVGGSGKFRRRKPRS